MSQDQPPNKQSHPPEAPDGAPPSTSLEEVRKRLESFGYLNSRIERFYLQSLSRTASQFLNRLFVSFRVGLLAGTVAAVLMTAGTLVFNTELLRRKLDILLLFIYFESFFVLLFTVLEFLLIFLVSVLLRISRGRRLVFAGQAVSFLIGLSFFAYFFYWGRTQIEYLRLFSNVSIAAMFLIVTLSCIFVAKCAWLGFLVAFRESDLGRILPNWRRFNLEFLLGLTAILILLPFILNRGESGEKEHPPVAVFSTNDRWILLAIDGVSRETLNHFAKTENIPHLRSLMAQTPPADFRILERSAPPVVWTSIATGVSPAQHGIRTPEVKRWRGQSSWIQETPLELAVHSIMIHAGFGQRQPVSGYLRKVKTFWEILSDNGLRAGVVNWWGSWPARNLRGWNVSERYYYKLASGGQSQEETFPRKLFQQYSSLYKGGSNKISGPDLDLFYLRLFNEQLKKDPVRVAALYLPGFDILNYEHYEARRIDPFSYTEAFVRHLNWIDNWLLQLQSQHPEYRVMMIFYQGRALPGHHSAMLVTGAQLTGKTSYSEYDVTPMLLYSCGLPLARDMKTELIRSVIARERLEKTPVRYVAEYTAPRDRVEFSHADQFNDLLVEQMKSLGYLQ
ncbi:alkaline phosphatase family protein [bacterium]|nr:alkaline phosphatase family protein [bacterium]